MCLSIEETDEIKLNQMEVVCTFCLTGTRPDDEKLGLGKRAPLDESDDSSDGEDDEEEERIYAGLNGLSQSEIDPSLREGGHNVDKFKLVKKSEDDIEVDFKEPTPEEQPGTLLKVLEPLEIMELNQDSSKTYQMQNWQYANQMTNELSPRESISEKNLGEIPLKEKDHNQELSASNSAMNRMQIEGTVKIQVSTETKPSAVKSTDVGNTENPLKEN